VNEHVKFDGDPRASGDVRRYHTWDVREQLNSSHQWHVARILLAVDPGCRKEMLVEALMHDTGELRAGDAPYPLKAAYPEVKQILDAAERDGRLDMALPWGLPAPQNLTETERALLRFCDYMEAWEFGLDEIERGNARAVAIVHNARRVYVDKISLLDHDTQARARHYIFARIRRHDRTMRELREFTTNREGVLS
jgi:hypothetical protein